LPDALEIAERAVAASSGEALAHVAWERSLMLRFAANRPTQATSIDNFAVELAVLRDGHVGRATTNAVDSDALAGCARRARHAAEAAAASGRGSYPGFPAGAEFATHHGFDPDTARLEAEPGGAALAAAFECAGRVGLEAHGIWTVAETQHAVATRDWRGWERSTDAYMKVICIAPSGRSGYAARTGRRGADLDGRALTEEALAKATRDGEPAHLPPGEYTVVMEPHAVGWLLDLLAGTAFNGLAHAEARGALVGRLGEQVTAPSINLADSPFYPKTLPRASDPEGTPKRPLPLIQDGVAANVVHDRRSAALAGAESTGHALAPGGDPQGPHAINLVLAGGGAASLEELCEPVERGIYITRLWYANVVRPKETLVTAVTRDGTFLIEDGRVTRPLRDLRLTDSLLGILSRAQALTAAQQLTSDGEFYGRRFAYGVVCPGLRAASVRFTAPAG
jgi:PmbA protein